MNECISFVIIFDPQLSSFLVTFYSLRSRGPECEPGNLPGAVRVPTGLGSSCLENDCVVLGLRTWVCSALHSLLGLGASWVSGTPSHWPL